MSLVCFFTIVISAIYNVKCMYPSVLPVRLLQLDSSFSKEDFPELGGTNPNNKKFFTPLDSQEEYLNATSPKNVLLFKKDEDIHKR